MGIRKQIGVDLGRTKEDTTKVENMEGAFEIPAVHHYQQHRQQHQMHRKMDSADVSGDFEVSRPAPSQPPPQPQPAVMEFTTANGEGDATAAALQGSSAGGGTTTVLPEGTTAKLICSGIYCDL